MKTELKQLLRDLKAAALLGRPEALDIALDGLLALPGVAANDRLEAGFIEKAILPVGTALQTLPAAQLRPLLDHHLAAGRAIGAVALAQLFLQGKNATPKDLRRPGSDSRSDVRLALGRALFVGATTNLEKLLAIGTNWLEEQVPKLRHTALLFIPALAKTHSTQIIELLSPLDQEEDFNVRTALVAAMTTMANEGLAAPVLTLLARWGSESSPNSWVICRTLSGSWASGYPAEVTAILQALKSKTRESSHITGAVKALQRHGLEINLQ